MSFGFRMIRNAVLCSVVFGSVLLPGSAARAAVYFAWATVSGAGNAADTTGFGTVDHIFQIDIHEVSNTQYAEFLNAVAVISDTYGLYNTSMGSGHGGIGRIQAQVGFQYTAFPSRAGMPVNYVSFYDCLRFINWLENGQPASVGEQVASTTEDGAYTFTDATTVGGRNSGATYFMPTEDEWYKAAYYDPASKVYYDYPTGSNTAPTCAAPGTTNTANCDGAVGDLTGGSYLSSSPVGTYDQGGNVWEWNEAVNGIYRGIRGGSFDGAVSTLAASGKGYADPTSEFSNFGFRVVQVPEPGQGFGLLSALLTLAGLQRLRA